MLRTNALAYFDKKIDTCGPLNIVTKFMSHAPNTFRLHYIHVQIIFNLPLGPML